MVRATWSNSSISCWVSLCVNSASALLEKLLQDTVLEGGFPESVIVLEEVFSESTEPSGDELGRPQEDVWLLAEETLPIGDFRFDRVEVRSQGILNLGSQERAGSRGRPG